MSDPILDDARGDADIDAFAVMDATAFGESPEDTARWLHAAADRVRIRTARVDGALAGGYALLPSGQFFGGRSVETQCVVSVVVDALHRRRGVAGRLMQDAVRTARDMGTALAPLNAATTRLYRRWGWEVGARHINQMVRTDALASLRGEGQLVAEPSSADVTALRSAYFRAWDGPLDRPAWWLDLDVEVPEKRRLHPRVGWVEDGTLTGFLRYDIEHRANARWMTLDVDECVATTEDATRGLLGHLGSHEAQTREIAFRHTTMPQDSSLLYLVPEVDWAVSITGSLCWMQRIVDLAKAVEQRGWGGEGRVELEIHDPADGTTWRCVLEVGGGTAAISEGGAGTVSSGIGALSSWFSGALRAVDAARLGLMQGSPAGLEAMDAAIGPRSPWMPDMF